MLFLLQFPSSPNISASVYDISSPNRSWNLVIVHFFKIIFLKDHDRHTNRDDMFLFWNSTLMSSFKTVALCDLYACTSMCIRLYQCGIGRTETAQFQSLHSIQGVQNQLPLLRRSFLCFHSTSFISFFSKIKPGSKKGSAFPRTSHLQSPTCGSSVDGTMSPIVLD